MADIRRADRIQQLAGGNDYIVDASETGIALILENTSAVVQGREVLIEVASGARAVQLRATVIYLKDGENKGEKQAGFRYEGITAENKQLMAEMIDAYSKGVPIRAKIIR